MAATSVTRKIPGGKMMRLDVSFSDRIERIKITGDFFLHPEETLDLLTEAIYNTTLPLDANVLTAKLDQVLMENDAQFIGASVADLVSILHEATT